MSAQAKFDTAVEIVGIKEGPIKPSTEDQLKFYSLYKQATIGDVNTERPGMMDFAGKKKWDSWKSVSGKSTEQAQLEYYDALVALLEASDAPEAKEHLARLKAL